MNSDVEAIPTGEELLETFMHFPDPLALLDSEGRVHFVNRQFTARFGAGGLDAPSLRAAARGAAEEGQVVQLPPDSLPLPGVRARALRTRHGILLILGDLQDASEHTELEKLRELIAELERFAATDHLTGTWNRAHLDRVIEVELGRSLATRQPLSLVLIDIDHFKRINDTYGHAVGDLILRETVDLVRSRIRSADVLFRWGGEEFVVLVSSAGYRGAARVAEVLRKAVAEHNFGIVGSMTISAGVAEHVGTESVAEWFHRLDAALYSAKNGGRNRVVVNRNGNSDTWATEAGGAALHLVWQEGYECGNATIDAEHRELFALSNALIDAAARNESDPAAVRVALDALITHVARHFADEETILARHHYTQLEEHKRAHAGLLKRAGELKARFERGDAGFGSIVEYLAQDVVARHMIATDSGFFPLFAAAGGAPG